jgi:hypothetical protein
VNNFTSSFFYKSGRFTIDHGTNFEEYATASLLGDLVTILEDILYYFSDYDTLRDFLFNLDPSIVRIEAFGTREGPELCSRWYFSPYDFLSKVVDWFFLSDSSLSVDIYDCFDHTLFIS